MMNFRFKKFLLSAYSKTVLTCLKWEQILNYIPASFSNLVAAFWTIAGTAVYMEVFFTTCNKSLF